MMKYIFTFGSNHLKDFSVRAMDVMLVVEGETVSDARSKVFQFDGIGKYFCTSYPYTEKIVEKFYNYGMKEFSLIDLESLRR